MKKFEELTEREILALAITLEEEDERVYADFVDGLRQEFPATAAMFLGMREEESEHRRKLIELFRQKFGEHIPLIRRQDVRGLTTATMRAIPSVPTTIAAGDRAPWNNLSGCRPASRRLCSAATPDSDAGSRIALLGDRSKDWNELIVSVHEGRTVAHLNGDRTYDVRAGAVPEGPVAIDLVGEGSQVLLKSVDILGPAVR